LACATADTDSDGGAVYLADASAGSRIVNSIFARNSATRDGGAVHLLSTGSSLDIMHCTFYTNSAGRDGGALHSQGGVSLSITNTIIYENEAGLNGPELEIFGTCEIDYSNIDQSRTVGLDVIGANMFNTDPLFIDAANDDFGLMPLSPLIDAGLTLDNVKMDIAGTRRPRGKTSDIGARESPNDPSALMLRIL
jgi:predicted outer membrane repeat protein